MSAKGWLLSIRGRTHVAVGARELVYVLPEEPEIHGVPLAPAPTPGVIVWENRVVPLIDVALRLGMADEGTGNLTTTLAGMHYFVAIVAFAGDDLLDVGVELGALILTKVPEQVEVSDHQGRELPPEFEPHAELFASCFEHPELGAVPILDLTRLFASSGYRHERAGAHAWMSVQ